MSTSSELYRIQYHFWWLNPLDNVFEKRVEEIYSKARPKTDIEAIDLFIEKTGQPAAGLFHYDVVEVV